MMTFDCFDKLNFSEHGSKGHKYLLFITMQRAIMLQNEQEDTMNTDHLSSFCKNWRIIKKLFILISLLLFFIPSWAVVLYVNSQANPEGANGEISHPFVEIQEAIDYAAGAITGIAIVNVSPGVYQPILIENFSDCDLSIVSSISRSATIDGESSESPVVIRDCSDPNIHIVIEGFNLINGFANNVNNPDNTFTTTGTYYIEGPGHTFVPFPRTGTWYKAGGGLIASNVASLELINCNIQDNDGAKGSAIFVGRSSVKITGCDIVNNRYDSESPTQVIGAALCSIASDVEMSDSRIWGNGDNNESFGNLDVVYIDQFDEAAGFNYKLRNCLIYDNDSYRDVLYVESDRLCNLEITNSTIVSNRTSTRAALYLGSLSFGGQLFDVDLINNIIRDNTRLNTEMPYSQIEREIGDMIRLRMYNNNTSSDDLLTLNSWDYRVGTIDKDALFTAPQNHDYSLIWNENQRSPLINAGYTGINNDVTDPDGTPPDIGAIYYPHHHEVYNFDRSPEANIFWMSFPVVDDRTSEGEQHWNELGHIFENHMLNAPDDSQLLSASWSYYTSVNSMEYFNGDWRETNYSALQPKGFKLKFNENIGEIDPVVVNGFKVNAATTPVELKREYTVGNNTSDFENWIGYFVPYTQGAGTAFSRFVPGSIRETYLDHIYGIETQTWSTKRIDIQYDSPWIIDPNRYTLEEGDMVSIKLLPAAPEEMFWMSMSQAEPPRTKEVATSFSYIEELEYTPIFIEFDPNDLPAEVGIYVSGVCKGAAVVDSTLIEVNYYATEAKNDSDIEIMFYYGNKGMKKAPVASVYNPETMLFEAGSIKTNQLGEYGYISFNRSEGSSLVPLVTELKQNYPNPFKGETNISWVLGKDAPISVDVYNLRGQKVKTLFNGIGKKGRQYLNWDAKDSTGQKVASGVYFYRLNTPDGTKVQKMLVLK
jgi:hypothetical protein